MIKEKHQKCKRREKNTPLYNSITVLTLKDSSWDAQMEPLRDLHSVAMTWMAESCWKAKQ
jgi:hypothetical protein